MQTPMPQYQQPSYSSPIGNTGWVDMSTQQGGSMPGGWPNGEYTNNQASGSGWNKNVSNQTSGSGWVDNDNNQASNGNYTTSGWADNNNQSSQTSNFGGDGNTGWGDNTQNFNDNKRENQK
jgi:hypothetical protein